MIILFNKQVQFKCVKIEWGKNKGSNFNGNINSSPDDEYEITMNLLGLIVWYSSE